MANIQLAANLRRLRSDHNYTQAQISDKLNISRQAYSNYETGKRIPDLDILIRIADIYHTTAPLSAGGKFRKMQTACNMKYKRHSAFFSGNL